MKKIKERCVWSIGLDRLLCSNYDSFIYSEDGDIILADIDMREFGCFKRESKKMEVGKRYTLGKFIQK